MKIAIDGPGGAGKSTLSKRLAAQFGFVYIDTGAMYRAAGLLCLRRGLSIRKQQEEAAALVSAASIDLRVTGGAQHIFLNGEDVTDCIRTRGFDGRVGCVGHSCRAPAFGGFAAQAG